MNLLDRFVITAVVLISLISSDAMAQDRIVSLGGDVTEIVYALGKGDKIVATDSTSVFPAAARETPKAGYVRQLSAEGVLSVEPDLILISGAAGPDTAIDQIRATGIPIVEMDKVYSVDAILEKIRRVASVLDVAAKGEELSNTVTADWHEASKIIEGLPPGLSVLFFSTVSDGTPTAAGRETAGQGVIDLLGGRNLFDDQIGYKPISMEAAVAADPDIILVMDFVAERLGGSEEVRSHPAIALTRAARTDQIYIFDAVKVMQFSPRTPTAVGALAEEIQTGLDQRDDQ